MHYVKSAYSELFWFVFSRIWIEHGEILHISLYSVQMRESKNQKISEYEHFSHLQKLYLKISVSIVLVYLLSALCFFRKNYETTSAKLYFKNLYCDPKLVYMLTLNLTLKSRDFYDGVCDIHYLLFQRRTFVKKNKKSYFW